MKKWEIQYWSLIPVISRWPQGSKLSRGRVSVAVSRGRVILHILQKVYCWSKCFVHKGFGISGMNLTQLNYNASYTIPVAKMTCCIYNPAIFKTSFDQPFYTHTVCLDMAQEHLSAGDGILCNWWCGRYRCTQYLAAQVFTIWIESPEKMKRIFPYHSVL